MKSLRVWLVRMASLLWMGAAMVALCHDAIAEQAEIDVIEKVGIPAQRVIRTRGAAAIKGEVFWVPWEAMNFAANIT